MFELLKEETNKNEIFNKIKNKLDIKSKFCTITQDSHDNEKSYGVKIVVDKLEFMNLEDAEKTKISNYTKENFESLIADLNKISVCEKNNLKWVLPNKIKLIEHNENHDFKDNTKIINI